MSDRGAQPLLVVADVGEWRAWLQANDETSDGVWLTLAKKGTVLPTSLLYQDALEEALCSGWIDGQAKRVDENVYMQRFTPRRKRSVWSKRNVEIVGRLADEGRLRERGIAEIERAKADGRWERAYAGPATVEVPEALVEALAANPAARSVFDAMSKSDRFVAMHSILTAPNAATKERRIASLVTRLSLRAQETEGE